jgi:hypothetical protein
MNITGQGRANILLRDGTLSAVLAETASVQVRWMQGCVVAQLVAAAGGVAVLVLTWTLLVTFSAGATWQPPFVSFVVSVLVVLAMKGLEQAAKWNVVRGRARRRLATFADLEDLAGQAAALPGGWRREYAPELGFAPVEAAHAAREAVLVATAARLGLSRSRLDMLAPLCRRWPDQIAVLLSAAHTLDSAEFAALAALAPTWSLSPAELVALTRTV